MNATEPSTPPSRVTKFVPRAKDAPAPFAWNIASGAEVWTDDPAAIASMSDRPIIEGLLREREVVTVVGGAKTMKTWFTMHLAIAVAERQEFLGRDVTNGRVIFLDYELKGPTFTKRLCMAAEKPPRNFDYQILRGSKRLPAPSEISELVREKGYKLVVIDSLYRTGWLGEENNNDSTGRELTVLQTLTEETGASVLVVDHTGKGGGKERSAVDAARGASAKGGFFDALFVLRPQEKAAAGQPRAILDAVLRDWPTPEELPVIGYDFTPTSCRLELVGMADRSDVKGTRQLVFEAAINAGKEGVSVVEAMEIVALSKAPTRDHLNALADDGKLIRFEDSAHKQRLRYRGLDLGDPNPTTALNRTKPH